MQTITLADGRNLAFETYGDPQGSPVIFCHGFGDSRLIRNPDENLTASLGIFVVAADQPGVGGSSPQPGRTMADWGPDMEQLADHMGLQQFAVAGHSGGGPHALSIAKHLPERVTRGVLASPVGPFDQDGFAKMLVMRDLKLIVKLRHFHHIIRWAYKGDVRKAHKDIGSSVETMAEGDPSDATTFLSDPQQREMFEANFAAGIVQDEEGLYEMTMALWNWGFALEDIHQPFDVFYGDADDIISPKMPAHVAERLPNATPHLWPGAGHYGFIDRDRWIDYWNPLSSS
ncbi:alpha/beta fold hydrolase [Calycomorphotria hydatis]|uniref:Tropinesterase n=1 Tax=Calycomorphotria hydatis TaxID=2528027 RepID=A0A517TCU6_9PLAN|nr:alpha/beta hydrolase [Calycomorphotria hydatis]QDT66195.1 Tropinesterase [Calycomorphotria hydatis]